MQNRPYLPQTKYRYLSNEGQLSSFVRERDQYNNLIQKLNRENEYLSQNVKQLIQQNLTLKTQISQKGEFYPVTERNNQKDYKKLEGSEGHQNQKSKNRVERVKINKNQIKEISPQTKNVYKHNVQKSLESSYLKRATIIEDLSQSHFRRNTESPMSKTNQSKRGIKLISQTTKLNKSTMASNIKRTNTQQLNNFLIEKERRFQNEIEKDEKEQKRIQSSKNNEVTLKNKTEFTTITKHNPEEEILKSYRKEMIHKKNNSPYLQPKKNNFEKDPPKSSNKYEAKTQEREIYQNTNGKTTQRYKNDPYLNRKLY